MKILVYYNVLHKNFIIIFDDYAFDKRLGQIYKVNSELISILDINEKTTPLQITFKKLKNYKHKFGSLLIDYGQKLQGNKKSTPIIQEKQFPWWKL